MAEDIRIEYMPLADLAERFWEANPKEHNIGDLSLSLNRFGFVNPVIVNEADGGLLAGHGRVKALLALKREGRCPERIAERDGDWLVPVVRGIRLEGADAPAYSVADNQLTVGSSYALAEMWDLEALAGVLQGLKAEGGLGLEGTGFDESGLMKLLTELANQQEAREETFDVGVALETQAEPRVKRGEVWRLGKHRLMCGNSTSAEDVAKLMGREDAGLVITSPPYFNQREYSQWETYEDYLHFAGQVADGIGVACSDDCLIVLNIGSDEPAHRWLPSDWWVIFRERGWAYQEAFAWVKAAAVWSVPRSMHIESGHYFPALRWEVILVISRGKHPSFDQSDRDEVRTFQDNVWELPVVTGGEQKKLGHAAPFPLEIPKRFCLAYCHRGDRIYEPFVGSGTTIIAADQLGRICYGMEIVPAYATITLDRWEAWTGKKGVRIDD